MSAIIWLCAAGAVVIFGVMLHSIATFRSSPTGHSRASGERRHAIVEVAWALIPILIVIAAAVPSLRIAADSPADSLFVIAATE